MVNNKNNLLLVVGVALIVAVVASLGTVALTGNFIKLNPDRNGANKVYTTFEVDGKLKDVYTKAEVDKFLSLSNNYFLWMGSRSSSITYYNEFNGRKFHKYLMLVPPTPNEGYFLSFDVTDDIGRNKTRITNVVTGETRDKYQGDIVNIGSASFKLVEVNYTSSNESVVIGEIFGTFFGPTMDR